MNDAFDADKNPERQSCFLNIFEATQLIVKQDIDLLILVYCWDDYENKDSEGKFLLMTFYLN